MRSMTANRRAPRASHALTPVPNSATASGRHRRHSSRRSTPGRRAGRAGSASGTSCPCSRPSTTRTRAPVGRDLGDREHDAAAVGAAADVDDGVDRGRDLRAHRGDRQRDAGEQRQRLEPGERRGRTVGVDGRQRTVVTGVERLQHVERFAAADLTDDQPVGPHAQRGRARARAPVPRPTPSAFAGRASNRTTCGCGNVSSVVSSMVTMRSRGSIDRGERVAQRRLARARRARDEQVPAAAHHRVDEVAAAAVDTERVEPDGPGDEAPDGDARAVGGERREHRVEPGSVGQAGVDERRRVVEAETERRDDPLGQAGDGVRIEGEVDRFDAAAALDVRPPGPVDHDLVHVRVGEPALERTEAADVVDQRIEHAVRLRAADTAAPPRAAHRPAGRAVRRGPSCADRTAARAGAGARCRATSARSAVTVTRPGLRARHSRRAARTSRRGLGQRVGQPHGEHAGVDDACHRGAHGHGCEHREPEDVGDVARAERAARLLDEHDARRAGGRRHAHRAPEREVATPHDEDRCVRDLEQGFERCRRRGRRRRRRSARRCSRNATPSAAPTSGGTSVRSSRPDGSSVTPCAAGKPSRSNASTGASTPTRSHSRRPVGGSAARPRIDGWSPSRSARRTPSMPRASVNAHAAANTDVPEPPFGDQQQTSTTPPVVSETPKDIGGRVEFAIGRTRRDEATRRTRGRMLLEDPRPEESGEPRRHAGEGRGKSGQTMASTRTRQGVHDFYATERWRRRSSISTRRSSRPVP